MAKKIHILGISPCFMEEGKKDALELLKNKNNSISAVFTRKEDMPLIVWLREQLSVLNKNMNLGNNDTITHLNNALIFYDSKTRFIIDYIKGNLGKKGILIFANGDPNFFGIGGSILKELKSNEKRFVEVYPSYSYMQIGFLRLKIPMTDSAIVSAHGRNFDGSFYEYLSSGKNIGIYTDPQNTPIKIFNDLSVKGFTDSYDFNVLTDLCSKNEKLYKNASMEILEDISCRKNIIILEKKPEKKTGPKNLKTFTEHTADKKPDTMFQKIGIDDDKFFHISGEPTKKEIRAISLSMMGIKKDSIIIDAGCGSGSVSIEASGIAEEGTVYSIDKNGIKIENLKKNISKFGRNNIVPIKGELPHALQMLMINGSNNILPLEHDANGSRQHGNEMLKPDIVFIGGGSEKLKEILEQSCSMVKESGAIVVNSIMLSSFVKLISFINEYNASNKKFRLDYSTVAANISRLKDIQSDSYFQALNQVFITKIKKVASVKAEVRIRPRKIKFKINQEKSKIEKESAADTAAQTVTPDEKNNNGDMAKKPIKNPPKRRKLKIKKQDPDA